MDSSSEHLNIVEIQDSAILSTMASSPFSGCQIWRRGYGKSDRTKGTLHRSIAGCRNRHGLAVSPLRRPEAIHRNLPPSSWTSRNRSLTDSSSSIQPSMTPFPPSISYSTVRCDRSASSSAALSPPLTASRSSDRVLVGAITPGQCLGCLSGHLSRCGRDGRAFYFIMSSNSGWIASAQMA